MVCKSNQNNVYCTTYLDIILKSIKTNEIKPTEEFGRQVANLSRVVKTVLNEYNVNNIQLLLCFRHQYRIINAKDGKT